MQPRVRFPLALVASLCSASTSTASASPQRLIEDVSAARGIGPYVMAPGLSAGVTAVDFDLDGDTDLFVPNGAGLPDQLYVNDGAGMFTESASTLGLDLAGNHRGAIWLDIDNDRDLDLLVGGDCSSDVACDSGPALHLHRQRADGTFEEITQGAGLDVVDLPGDDTQLGGLAAGDLDGDGDMDVVVSYWEGFTYLFINDGNGVFTEEAGTKGIAGGRPYWQPVIFDVDGDGRQDIFQAVDFLDNHLWIQQPDGTFVDRAPAAGVDSDFNEMGVAVGDHNRDGHLDIYVTNIRDASGRHNTLYQRRKNSLRYDDVALQVGADDSGCGWGTTFVDVDHDGWMEIAAMNSCPWAMPRLFWNRLEAERSFTDVAGRAGFDGVNGTGLACFDMDGDGDRDFAQVTPGGIRLLENRHVASPSRGYLTVRPRIDGPNLLAAGTKITVMAPGLRSARVVLTGSSIMGQEPAEAHFGVGDLDRVHLLVTWPDGEIQRVQDVPTHQVLDLWRP